MDTEAPGPSTIDVGSAATEPEAPSGPHPAESGAPPLSDPPGPGSHGDERPPRPTFRLGNRPPLTGFRAIALSTVLVYHSNFKTWPGSWIAIQMFFVLSGFLITAMLSSEGQRNGRVSLKRFYSRRAARLLPPLALTIALLIIYVSFVHVADASARVWGDDAAAMFYYADYRQALGHAPFFGYLAQTWSLSVEEQFYVIWSVLMVISVALHRRWLAYAFAVTGLVATIGDRLWLTYSAPHFNDAVFTRVYYAFDTRSDAIFFGCLLGLLATDGYLSGWRRTSRRVLTVAAAASIAFLIWILYNAPLFQEKMVVWWIPATTLASAAVIVYFVICPEGIGSRMMGWTPFVFLGDLTYTLYLVHFPVYLALEPGADGTHWSYGPTEVMRLAIIFAISIGSWFLIERPLASWRQRSAAR